jgi:hypothetical protein
MSEAKRRQFKYVPSSLAEAESLIAGGHACGWRDCDASFTLPMPAGWVSLIAYEGSPGETVHTAMFRGERRSILDLTALRWRHDLLLCPEHAKALAGLLVSEADAIEVGPAGHA